MASPAETAQGDDGSWITTEFLQQVLQNAEKEANVSILNKNITFAVAKGDNYLSTLFRVEVEFQCENTEVIKKGHFIVKGYPNGELMQKFVRESGLFQRELDIYLTVLPAINSFVENKLQNQTKSTLFVSVKAYPTTRDNTLVLEDLKHKGFIMANRRNLLDFNHCLIVLRTLAQLHGMSAAFHQHNPDFLVNYKEVIYCESNRKNMEDFLPKQIISIVKKVKSWPGFEKYGVKLEKFASSVVDEILEVVKPQNSVFNVLTHGDCWINNFLFKYSSSGEIEDVRLIDFQLSRFGSPALDLVYILYTSCTNEVRDKRMDELLVEYHQELTNTLTILGCKADSFTFQDLMNEMNRMACFGLANACGVVPVVVTDPEDVPNLAEFTEDDMRGEDFDMWAKTHNNSKFREVFQNIILHFDKLGLFD